MHYDPYSDKSAIVASRKLAGLQIAICFIASVIIPRAAIVPYYVAVLGIALSALQFAYARKLEDKDRLNTLATCGSLSLTLASIITIAFRLTSHQ